MRLFLLLFLIVVSSISIQAQDTSTPVPDLFEGVNNPVATAAGYVNELPSSLDTAPNGTSFLPRADVGELFKYVKWILSYTVLQELFGATLAPIPATMGIYLIMAIIITGVYFILFVFVLLFRFAAWLFNLILQILQVLAALVGDVVKFAAALFGL